jgi:hypothetical protein
VEETEPYWDDYVTAGIAPFPYDEEETEPDWDIYVTDGIVPFPHYTEPEETTDYLILGDIAVPTEDCTTPTNTPPTTAPISLFTLSTDSSGGIPPTSDFIIGTIPLPSFTPTPIPTPTGTEIHYTTPPPTNTATLGTFPVPVTEAEILPAPTVLGDTDGDENLTIGDVIRLSRHLVGTYKLSPQEKANADVDGNGVVDVADAFMLTQRIANIIDEFK